MARACANCGTEVDDEALFCPTCGEPINRSGEPDLPPAPDWPATSTPEGPTAEATEEPPRAEPMPAEPVEPAPTEPTRAASPMPARVEAPPPADGGGVPPWRRGAAYRAATPPPPSGPAAPIPPRPGALRPEGFVRPPDTLSGWLIGIGALVGTVAMLLPWVVVGTYIGSWGLASGINLLFTLVLIGVLVLVFLPHLVPDVPHKDLVLLGVALIGVGVGLDRLGLPLTGMGATIFLIGMLAFATGAFLAQLGLDRQVGGAQP